MQRAAELLFLIDFLILRESGDGDSRREQLDQYNRMREKGGWTLSFRNALSSVRETREHGQVRDSDHPLEGTREDGELTRRKKTGIRDLVCGWRKRRKRRRRLSE